MSYYQPDNGLQFAYWPVQTEKYCPTPVSADWLTTGCQHRAEYLAPPGGRDVACKNGVPYDCRCNLIDKPYSMPYEAKWKTPGCTKPGCSKGQGTWYMRPPYFMKQT